MELSPEQKQAFEQQKENCPFCKIIKGDIPSKKVFEDDNFMVILDINPATKGHMLVVPKEHYPIMPVMPPPMMNKLFALTKEVSGICYSGLVTPGSTVFIANGGAAGQQSQHFLLHVIPRDKNDGLGMFAIPIKTGMEEEVAKILDPLRNNVSIMMRKHIGGGAAGMADIAAPKQSPEEYVKGVIEMNPPLLELVLKQPAEFKKMTESHPQLKDLFADKDVDKIINDITEKHAGKTKAATELDEISKMLSSEAHGEEESQEDEEESYKEETEDKGTSEEEEDEEIVETPEEIEADFEDVVSELTGGKKKEKKSEKTREEDKEFEEESEEEESEEDDESEKDTENEEEDQEEPDEKEQEEETEEPEEEEQSESNLDDIAGLFK